MLLGTCIGATRVQVPTKRLPSSPPCLLCRSPGPGPSAASLRRPKPHLPWVCKLTPARDATERARDCLRWTPSEAIARAFRRPTPAPPTVKCPDPQPSCTRRMDAVIICRPSLPKFGAIAAKGASWQFIATRPGDDEAASQLTTSPSLSPSWPRPISTKSELSQTVLILGDEAHSGSYHGSYGLTHARFTHRHRRHALPLHTCSSTTPPKHSPAQSGQGPPLGDPGSLWLATALGSSAAVSALATTARRRQALRSVWWTCCRHGRRAHAAHIKARHWARSSRLWRRV